MCVLILVCRFMSVGVCLYACVSVCLHVYKCVCMCARMVMMCVYSYVGVNVWVMHVWRTCVGVYMCDVCVNSPPSLCMIACYSGFGLVRAIRAR